MVRIRYSGFTDLLNQVIKLTLLSTHKIERMITELCVLWT